MDRGAEERLAAGFDCAEMPHVAGAHVRVGVQARAIAETFVLPLARGDDTFADPRARLAGLAGGQCSGIECGDLDVQVDAVEKGAGESTGVALDLGRRADSGGRFASPMMSARAGVHRAGEHETRGVAHGEPCAAEPDRTLLDRLPERLERGPPELRQLVEEEDAVVRERGLAGPWDRAAADQPGVRDGVVRRAERRESTRA